jgi:ribosomal protein S27AE
MSSIKPLPPDKPNDNNKETRCPRCNSLDTLFIDEDKRTTCSICGYKDKDAHEDNPPASENTFARAQKYTVSYGIEHLGEIDTWTRAVYHTGLDHIRREEYDEAMRSFYRALESERDFIDAHLWIGRLSDDPDVKREHFSEVIAQMPNHQEAMRELMVLNGQLSADESARSADASHDPQQVRPDAPAKAQTEQQICPNCGGALHVDLTGTQVVCGFCSYVKPIDSDRGYGLDNVSMALLQQRGKTIVWDVGEHLWHCDNCGADQIITGAMTNICPFCGSSHVMKTDALESFQQPDSIVPFLISEDDTRKIVREALNSRVERFKGLFVKNKVVAARMQATFVPMWYFDAVIEVHRTTTNKNTYYRGHQQVHRDKLTEMAHNVPVAGVDSPPRYLLQRTDNYDLDAVTPYDSALLSGYHAQLYTRNFERAMMLARKRISQTLRTQYGADIPSDKEVRVSPMFQQMFFRLILVPVYAVTLTESDGDVRPVVVNGQTGAIALGRAEKV